MISQLHVKVSLVRSLRKFSHSETMLLSHVLATNVAEYIRIIDTDTRGGTGSGVPESTPAGFCVFLSDPDPGPESKIWEKTDPESLFNFGSSRSRCDHFLSKNVGKLRLD